MNLTKIMHPALLVGEREFADSPARINAWLYGDNHTWVHLVTGKHLRVEVSAGYIWVMSGRVFRALRITRSSDGAVLRHPVYCSAGLATPGASPKGTWWPCSGVYTPEYCALRGHDPKWEGHIGKKIQSWEGDWHHHGKVVGNLPGAWQVIVQALKESQL